MTTTLCTNRRSLKIEMVQKFERGKFAAQFVQMHHLNVHLFTRGFVYKGRSSKKLLTEVQRKSLKMWIQKPELLGWNGWSGP